MNSSLIRSLPYFISYLVPIMTIYGMIRGGWWTFLTLGVMFGIVPLVELVLGVDTKNPTSEEDAMWKEHPAFSLLLWGHVVSQYVVLYYFLEFHSTSRSLIEISGSIISTGLMLGGIGITVAHELIHRKSSFEQFLGKLLLFSTNYLHFFIEHIRGHHKTVGTEEDPVSAKIGQSFYAIWFHAVYGSYANSWKLERERLQKKDLPFISIHNQIVRYFFLTLALNIFIFFFFGWMTFLFYLLASTLAFSLLEMVNYIEHYGLTREQRDDGSYEKVEAHHSWSSNNYLSRWFLFELTRHADHHLNASRKYQVLKNIDSSPQHPTGYPGMIFLALIPPLWFRVMDKKAKQAMHT